MKTRWYIISIISILLSIMMIFLFVFIPGFPLLIFLFFPPLFCWGLQGSENEALQERGPRYCPQCGKQLLEQFESYCPRCGTYIELKNEN